MIQPIPYILKDSFVAVMIDNKMSNIDGTHPNFQKIVDALRRKEWDTIQALIDLPTAVRKFGEDKVTVIGDVVMYSGQELHGTLVNRILKMIEQKFDVSPLILFLENVQKNPLESARKELYDFLEASNMPITEDGHFLAYKRVGFDFKDLHTHTFDNSPGQIVKEDRKLLDTNRNNTCSKGLHFAAFSYLNCYADAAKSRTVIVKINPADVVAIPTDYGNAKGRTCQYEVVGEYTNAISGKDVLRESPSVVSKATVMHEDVDIKAWDDVDLRKKLETLSMSQLVYLYNTSDYDAPKKFKNKEAGVLRILKIVTEYKKDKATWFIPPAKMYDLTKSDDQFKVRQLFGQYLVPPFGKVVDVGKLDLLTADFEKLTKNELICLHNELVLPEYRRKSFSNKEEAIQKIRALTVKELNPVVK